MSAELQLQHRWVYTRSVGLKLCIASLRRASEDDIHNARGLLLINSLDDPAGEKRFVRDGTRPVKVHVVESTARITVWASLESPLYFAYYPAQLPPSEPQGLMKHTGPHVQVNGYLICMLHPPAEMIAQLAWTTVSPTRSACLRRVSSFASIFLAMPAEVGLDAVSVPERMDVMIRSHSCSVSTHAGMPGMNKREYLLLSIDYASSSAPGAHASCSSMQAVVPFDYTRFTLDSIKSFCDQGANLSGCVKVIISALGGDTEEDAISLVRQAGLNTQYSIWQAHPDGPSEPIELANNRTTAALHAVMDPQQRPRLVVRGASFSRRTPQSAGGPNIGSIGSVPVSTFLPSFRRARAERLGRFTEAAERLGRFTDASDDALIELRSGHPYESSPPEREGAQIARAHRVREFDASLFSLGQHGDEEDIQAAIRASLLDQDAEEESSSARPAAAREATNKRKKTKKTPRRRSVALIHKLKPMPQNPDDPIMDAKDGEPHCSICVTRKTTHMAFPCMHAVACDVCVYDLAERFDRADPSTAAGKATRACCLCREPVKYYSVAQEVLLKPIYS